MIDTVLIMTALIQPSLIIGIALIIFVVLFLIGSVMYWFKKDRFIINLLNWSSIIMLILSALLLLAVAFEGTLFSGKVTNYF